MYYFPRKISYKKDNRLVPFAAPFLLGALTGGVAVGAVDYANKPKPVYPYYPPYYY